MSITSDKQINRWTLALSILMDVDNFDAAAFGLWLRKAREAAHLSTTALAKKAGVSKQYISMLEQANPHLLTNKPVQPSLEKVEQIGTALGANLDDLRVLAGYAPRKGERPKPQNAAEFAERLREMGFDISTEFDYEKLGPDELQDLVEMIETRLIMQVRKKEKAGG